MNLEHQWSLVCTQTQHHATMMGNQCGPEFVALINAEAQKFCDQPVPQTVEQMQARQVERIAASTKIGAISNAASWARRQPSATAEILAAVRDYCDRVGFDNQASLESIALSSTIAAICR